MPALLRAIVSSCGCEADWASQLLRELGGGELRERLLKRLNALLVDAKISDDSKARVLGLLADLKAPIPETVVLKDPDAMLERSVRDLLSDLGSPEALSQALDMIFEQVPPDELDNFLTEVVEHGGDSARPLLSGLVADPRTPRDISMRLVKWIRPTPAVAEAEPPQEIKPIAKPRMQRALRLLAHGQLGLAHKELLALRALRKDDPAVYSALGLCLLRLSRPSAALTQLEQALKLEPKVAAHAWNAAVAAHLSEKPDRLYKNLQKYLGCDDERHGAAARKQAAELLCREFERLVAEAYPGTPLARVLESEELFDNAYEALTDARYAAAAEGFRAVLERLPTHPASWRNLGVTYLAERRPREAARCFSRVLRFGHDSPRRFARADLE